MSKLIISTLVASAIASSTFADEAVTSNKLDDNFKGNVQLGFINLTGNTAESTINGKTAATYTTEKWAHQASLSAFSDDNSTSGDSHERYGVSWETKYYFSEKNFSYVNTDFLSDSNDGYDYIWNSSTGYGRTLYNNKDLNMMLDIQAGPGYRKSPNDDSTISNESITGNTAMVYKWQINKINSLQQNVTVSYSESNTVILYRTAYTANLYKNFGIQAGLDITQNTKVPADTSKVDTITTLNVLYSF